jgi:gamma-butyrobetaine dioxygenase|tara:strand:+ start:32 stop:1168 length:1137 start_codon:yes stop_codon:yes gene_type:complete
MTTKISKVSKNSSALNVEWSDGEKSNFNFLWLRDNCPTAHDKDSNHRMFNLLETSENIQPSDYKINSDGKLEIKWSEGNHTSYYDPNWLRKNCYTIKQKQRYVSPYKLWNNKLNSDLESVTVEHDKVINTEEGLIQWLNLLHEKGFAIIKNAPTEKKSAFPILNRISHIRQTFFKTPFEVINIPKPNNSAYTAHGLRNHIDLPYFEIPPGYQFLHCLINDAEGGMSHAVDGFFVAEYLKKNDPEVFNTLVRIPVKFIDKDYTQDKKRLFYAPEISLTKDGDYNDIRFSVATMGVMDCVPEDIEKFYKAHHKFGKLLHDDKFVVKFRLKPGDIFCFNNRRVLHGRTEFNPNSGHRHLQGYYIDRDEIIARLNYLNKADF